MYRKSSKGWLKHFDFILIDLISLHLAFVLSYVCRHGIGNPYKNLLYRNMTFMLTFIDFFVVFLLETLKGVLRRGYYQELAATVKHVVLVMLLAVLFLFTIQEGTSFSRSVLYFTAVFYIIFAYVTRILWKKHLQKRMENGGDRSLLIITSSDIAAEVVRSMQEHNYQLFNLVGIVLVDKDMKGQKIEGIPVLANEEDAANYVCREWIDEVFLVISEKYPYPQKLADQLLETGVTVHLNLAKMADAIGKKQLVEKLGDYTVLTTSINYATVKQAFMKRSLDIIGGLAGCILTGIIFIFVAPAIYIRSPGPIFFSQIRVGKNGKKFKMDRIDYQMPMHKVQLWDIENTNHAPGMIHPYHMHGTGFVTVARDGHAPNPNELGLKDTIAINPGEHVLLKVWFDVPGVFMYHCHILEHEDGGMMAQLKVVDPKNPNKQYQLMDHMTLMRAFAEERHVPLNELWLGGMDSYRKMGEEM